MSSTLSILPRAVEDVIKSSPTSYITHNRVVLMNNMSSILAGIALLFCMIVLGFTFVIWLDKEARKCLDRVSFRLIICSLISNCIYAIGYIICVQVGPGFWCVAGVWLIQFWLGITNWLITCIALNLQLVLVHSLNGIKLEKWYIIGTFVINLATTLPPLIKGKFGWDPEIKVCWLSESDNRKRLTWQISTQLAWILLTVFLTSFCSMVTIAHLYIHKFNAHRVLNSHASKRSSKHDMTDTTSETLVSQDDPRSSASTSLMNSHEFRKIILRISIYPIMMIIINLIIAIADIRISTASGIYTSIDYGVYVVYYALYGARGIFYAAIACLDPALLRAYKVWRGERLSSGSESRTGSVDKGVDLKMFGVPQKDEESLVPSGIKVQTEIETQVETLASDKVPQHQASKESISIIPNAGGLRTTINSANLPTKPSAAHNKASSIDDQDPINNKRAHWFDALEAEITSLDDAHSDTCSIYSMDGVGPSDRTLAYIENIRRKQSQRLQRRREAEKEVTRQI